MNPPPDVTGAISAVINRADDLGLREITAAIQRAGSLDSQRRTVMDALRAGEAVLAASLHFNMKPVAAFATELDNACHRAVRLIDGLMERTFEQAERDGVREAGAFTREQWAASGCRPPPMLTREEWEAGKRLGEPK